LAPRFDFISRLRHA
jgi:hypothetical protein